MTVHQTDFVVFMLKEGHPVDAILTRIDRWTREDKTLLPRLMGVASVWIVHGLRDLRDGKDRSISLEVLPRLTHLLFRFVMDRRPQ